MQERLLFRRKSLGATVKEVGDRVFMVLPAGCEVKDSDLKKLRADGYLK